MVNASPPMSRHPLSMQISTTVTLARPRSGTNRLRANEASCRHPYQRLMRWLLVDGRFPSLGVALAGPGFQKKAVVTGDRQWHDNPRGPVPSMPAPFVSMPLVWDRAFGGSDSSHTSKSPGTVANSEILSALAFTSIVTRARSSENRCRISRTPVIACSFGPTSPLQSGLDHAAAVGSLGSSLQEHMTSDGWTTCCLFCLTTSTTYTFSRPPLISN